MDILSFISNISLLSAVCFLLGFILIIVEMYLPGFGAPGVTGSILLFLGVIFTARTFFEVLILIIIILALLAMALVVVIQSAAKGRLSKHLILNESQLKEAGYIGMEDLEYFLNKEGRALTTLRPSGTADFDGVRLDVVTDGEFIQKDTLVKITKVQGRRIVVKAVDI